MVRDLPRDGSGVVDPAASFEVEVAVRLEDGRLSLLDERDAMVASEGTVALGRRTSRYHLTPAAPLRPGAAYTLHLDGAETREPHDAGGKAYAPLAVELRTSVPAAPPAPAARKGKRRR